MRAKQSLIIALSLCGIVALNTAGNMASARSTADCRTFAVSTTNAPQRARVAQGSTLRLTPRRIALARGRVLTLNAPEDFHISVAAEGMRRVRFMAQSPDGRLFVTDMYNRADNRRGIVYVLDGFDLRSGRFSRRSPFLTRLRNPNSIAFYTDARGRQWLYLALTDRLVRYRYENGTNAPTGEPQTLATFPAYGLDYRYGGWHLTRTVTVGGNGKIYVSVGSSCNSCEEREEVRATVLEMNPDGTEQRIFARGLRNSVGLRWIDNQLYATDMGSDHLGNDRPEDTFRVVRAGVHYGWPYCFQYRGRIHPDPQLRASRRPINCRNVPLAFAAFAAHSSPLGFDYFDQSAPACLRESFLVGLHGSSLARLGRGYRVARVRRGERPVDFITGFASRGGRVTGRPVDVLRVAPDAFFLTDDHAGVIYYVSRAAR